MSDLEPGATTAEVTKQSCACCDQFQSVWMLLALLILSCTVCLFLFAQRRYARQDLATAQQAATPIIQSFQQEKPRLEAFLVNLEDYGKRHPDFGPILNKYNNFKGILPATPPGTPAKK